MTAARSLRLSCTLVFFLTRKTLWILSARTRQIPHYVWALIDPRNGGPVFRLAHFLEKESRDLAILFMRFVLFFNPRNTRARSNLARLLFLNANAKGAREQFAYAFVHYALEKTPIPLWLMEMYVLTYQQDPTPEIEKTVLDYLPKMERPFDGTFHLQMLANFSAPTIDSALAGIRGQKSFKKGLDLAALVTVRDLTALEPGRARIHELLPVVPYSFTDPEIYENPQPPNLRQLETPATWIAEIPSAELIGASTVLQRNELIVVEPAAHPSQGLVAGAWQFVIGLKRNPGKAIVRQTFKSRRKINKAILISGRCSGNYYHWMIEYLPKFLNIELAGLPPDIPLLIRKGLASQQMEALEVFRRGREVIFFDDSERIEIGTLHCPSVHTFLPDRFDIPYWQSSAQSVRHLQFLRERVLKHFDLSVSGPAPRRIYLSRKAHAGRKLVNEAAVESLFKEAGFELVYPETLSLVEQLKLFAHADVIAGPGGAALTNTLFCKPGTLVVDLVSERNASFVMHASLATTAGARFVHISGPNVQKPEEFANPSGFAHSAYSIPLDKVERFLATLDKIGS